MAESPPAKRRRQYSKQELLDMLKENGDIVSKVVQDCIAELTPFDMNDEEEVKMEDRLDRLEIVSKNLSATVYRLKKDNKERKFRKKPNLLEEIAISCSQHSVLQSDDSESLLGSQDKTLSPEDLDELSVKERPRSYTKKPLNQEMTQLSRRRRVAMKRDTLTGWAEEEGVTVTQLLGYLLHVENYLEDRDTAAVGWKIFTGEKLFGIQRVTLEEATWMIEKAGISQVVWTEFRLKLLDRIWLPPVKYVREENKLHRPALSEYRHGVKAPLKSCLSLTLSERLQFMDLSSLDQASLKIAFKFCWGADGSGEQKNYIQLSKVSFSTKQVMSVCFSVRELTVTDSSGAKVQWDSAEKGANKPQNTRPLALFPAKETNELLEEFVPMIEDEIESVKQEGVSVNLGETELTCECQQWKMSMVDGKMVTNLLNLGGAYCTMCTKSQQECHSQEVVEGGFEIDRSVEQISFVALALSDPDSGDILKKRADYEIRQGVCGQPITTNDLTKSIPVCHSKIRVFEWTVELLVRELSHQKWSSPLKTVRYTESEKDLYKTTREQVKDDFYQQMAINIGNPGDMVTGQAFKSFSSDSSRAFICTLVREEIREGLAQILLGLCAVVKVLNSQKRKVNVEKLKALTQETYIMIIKTFPWAVISQSVHRVLAHSWEVMQENDGYGLGGLSEEGLEALNKQIRQMRSTGARKDCTLNNFTDTFNHLWDRSRPTIIEMEREIRRRTPRLMIQTEIEALVESLFVEDVQDI